MHKHKLCMTVSGLLVGLAGVFFLMFGLGMTGAALTHQVAGVSLLVWGVMEVVHAFQKCPFCAGKK